MSHRASLYSVRVRPHRSAETVVFGDYDGAGSWLGDVVDKAAKALNATDRNGEVVTRYEADLPGLSASSVGWTFVTGRGGKRSRIEREGDPPFLRTPEHLEHMRAGVLMRLPRGQSEGFLATHTPHGQGVKGVVERALMQACSQLALKLEINAVIPHNALRQAVDNDLIEKVTLIKREPGSADEFADATKWGEEVGRLELDVFARRSRRLGGGPVRRFLESPTAENRREIVEIAGLVFDEAAVQVEIEPGRLHTFYIDRPERGFPVSMDLELKAKDDADELGPAPELISARLRGAMRTVTGSA